jgi:cell division septation protein DedD
MIKIKIELLFLLLFLILPVLLESCSGSKETESQKGSSSDSVYVFDQPISSPTKKAAPIDQKVVVNPPSKSQFFIVQIGAFTTSERANEFADSVRKVLRYKIDISYSNSVNLYVVQIVPPFATKAEAEIVRNELWKNEMFRDAWILTVIR